MANEPEGKGAAAPRTPRAPEPDEPCWCGNQDPDCTGPASAQRKRCKATTRRGWPCPAFVNEGLEYCYGHAAHRIRELEDAILYALSEEGGFACPLSTVKRLLAALRERTPFKAEEY